MGHIKLIIFGIVMVGVVIFGVIFWGDLLFNQQQISNTPVPPAPGLDNRMAEPDMSGQQQAEMSSDDSPDSIERDLNNTEVEDMDSDTTDIEAEVNAI